MPLPWYCSDLFEYDLLASNRWEGKVDIVNAAPKPRAEFQVACFKGRAAYLFGGYSDDTRYGGSVYYGDGLRFEYNSDGDITSCCGLLPVGDLYPSQRAAATFTIDEERKRAVLIGGYSNPNMRDIVLNAEVWTCNVSRKLDSVSNSSRIVECSYCKKPAKCLLCSRCEQVKYCSRICQKADWSNHKLTSCKK